MMHPASLLPFSPGGFSTELITKTGAKPAAKRTT